ncbi:MAG: hypothetical protein LBT40_06470 [Deltaproteobacteria bacterium]|jgi:hypothetical protein|nr:hypothetical protein [Deltaproteobacteria bacterium]
MIGNVRQNGSFVEIYDGNNRMIHCFGPSEQLAGFNSTCIVCKTISFFCLYDERGVSIAYVPVGTPNFDIVSVTSSEIRIRQEGSSMISVYGNDGRFVRTE